MKREEKNNMGNIKYRGENITKGKSESGKIWYSVQVGNTPAFFTGQLRIAKKFVDSKKKK